MKPEERADVWRDCRLWAMKRWEWWVGIALYTAFCYAALHFDWMASSSKGLHYFYLILFWVGTGVVWMEIDGWIAQRVLKDGLSSGEICRTCGRKITDRQAGCRVCQQPAPPSR